MDKGRKVQDGNNFAVVTAEDAPSNKELQSFMTSRLLNYNEISLGVLFHSQLYFFFLAICHSLFLYHILF